MDTDTGEGRKDDQGKRRYDLIPADSLRHVADVFTFGAEKYGDRNWEKGISYERLVGAVMRHVEATREGEYTDPESGLPHFAHAVASLLMLLHLIEAPPPETGLLLESDEGLLVTEARVADRWDNYHPYSGALTNFAKEEKR